MNHLSADAAGIEVRPKARDLAFFYLQEAYAVVGDVVAVGLPRGVPLQRGVARVVGEDVPELALHLAEGVAVARPELAQAVVAREGFRHRDVAHVAVFGVDHDQGLDVSVFLQLPERLDEPVSHFFGHETTSHAVSVPRRGYCLPY